ncbi:MAG: serpin family protein, partial [Phycisphaerae bacterium]
MKRFLLILVTFAITAVGCANDKNIADANQSSDIDLLVKGLNSFAFEMYGKLNAENNLFFSPYSVSSALAMTYSGAKGNTEKEMAEALNIPAVNYFSCAGKVSSLWQQERYHAAFGTLIKQLNEQGRKGSYELITANALWGQKDYNFLKEFVWLIEKNYQGGLNNVDFINETEAARKTINIWVEQQTRDRIKDLIPQGVLSVNTRLVLTNAIYFKGSWANQFQKENTADELFYPESGKQITVAMMRQTERINYMQADGFEAIELPYLDNELSMVIFLPDKKSNIRQLEQKLNEESFSEWLNLMNK